MGRGVRGTAARRAYACPPRVAVPPWSHLPPFVCVAAHEHICRGSPDACAAIFLPFGSSRMHAAFLRVCAPHAVPTSQPARDDAAGGAPGVAQAAAAGESFSRWGMVGVDGQLGQRVGQLAPRRCGWGGAPRATRRARRHSVSLLPYVAFSLCACMCIRMFS